MGLLHFYNNYFIKLNSLFYFYFFCGELYCLLMLWMFFCAFRCLEKLQWWMGPKLTATTIFKLFLKLS